MPQQHQECGAEYEQQKVTAWTEGDGAEALSAPTVPQVSDRSVPTAFLCPLTLDIMKEPVMDRDGHTYEKRAILEWLERGHEICPLTRKPLRLSDIIPNRALQCRIEEWRISQGEDLSETEEDEENDFDPPFVGIINLPLDMQPKLGDMESVMNSDSAIWSLGNHRGQPVVFYYIPEDNRILELFQNSAAQQRLAEECVAEERCLTMTYVGLLCSLFLLFGIMIVILYQLSTDAVGI